MPSNSRWKESIPYFYQVINSDSLWCNPFFFHCSDRLTLSNLIMAWKKNCLQCLCWYMLYPSCKFRERMLSVLIICRVNEAQSRPRREYTPKTRPTYDYGDAENSNGGYTPAASNPPSYSPGKHAYQLSVAVFECVVFFGGGVHVFVHTFVQGLLPKRDVSKSLSFFDWCVFPSAALSSPSTQSSTQFNTHSSSILPESLHQEQTAWVRWMKITCHLNTTKTVFHYYCSLCCTCVA